MPSNARKLTLLYVVTTRSREERPTKGSIDHSPRQFNNSVLFVELVHEGVPEIGPFLTEETDFDCLADYGGHIGYRVEGADSITVTRKRDDNAFSTGIAARRRPRAIAPRTG